MAELVVRHREFLIKHVEPSFGLIPKLNATDVLPDVDKDRINAQITLFDRNTMLIERIQATGKYDGFIEALKICNQTHVVNYLEKDGINTFDDDWPLSDRTRSILRINQESLVDLLDVSELINPLYSADVINRRQRDFISSKQILYEKNEALLDILSRRSIRDYNKTISCLHESKQSHIAQILEEGGVVVRVHAEVPNDRTEDEIVSQFVVVLDNRSAEESRRILERTLNVIAVKKGKSIVIYIYCKTIDELFTLQELKTSGKLVMVLQKLFMDVLSFAKVTAKNPTDVLQLPFTEIHQRSQIEKMTATVDEEEYEKFEKYFMTKKKKVPTATLG